MTAFAASSQNSDTIVLNKQQVLRVLSKGLEAKALQEQRDLLLNEVDTLKARIAIKEMMITNLNGQISDYKNIKASQESIIQTMKDQVTILQNEIAKRDKALKKQRRKTRWTAFAGIIGTAAGLALFILK